jgi:hypothetical protein
MDSTTGASPATRSAINRLAPGRMPNPCPEKPVAMKNSGMRATWSITGTASGVTSINPAQLSTTCIPAKAGKRRDSAARA